MLKFWKEAGKTTAIRTELGKLTGNGSLATVSCTTPDHVRRFKVGEEWGYKLATPTNYTFAGGILTMVTTPATGTTVVAIGTGEYIFEDLEATGNDSQAAARTLEQKIYLESDGANAQHVAISLGDYQATGGLAVTHHYLSEGDSTSTPVGYLSAGSALSLGTISIGSIVPIWLKSIVPLGTAMDNYHDIYISGESQNFSAHE